MVLYMKYDPYNLKMFGNSKNSKYFLAHAHLKFS